MDEGTLVGGFPPPLRQGMLAWNNASWTLKMGVLKSFTKEYAQSLCSPLCALEHGAQIRGSPGRMTQGRNFGALPDCIQEAIKKIDLSGEARGSSQDAVLMRLMCTGCIPAVAIHTFIQQPTQDQPCISLVAMAYRRKASIYTSIYSLLLLN